MEVMKNMSRSEMEAFAFKHGVTDLRAILQLINQKKKEDAKGSADEVKQFVFASGKFALLFYIY